MSRPILFLRFATTSLCACLDGAFDPDPPEIPTEGGGRCRRIREIPTGRTETLS